LRGPAEETENDSHPLAGVLDRLLSRERGARSSPENVSVSPIAPVPPEPRHGPAPRRMLVVAGLGPTSGLDALQALARWGVQEGHKVAVVDFDPAPLDQAQENKSVSAPAARIAVPLASVPCGLDGLRHGDPGCVAAVADRLRCHESAADLLLVRIPAGDRQALAKAAFLAGGLILPLDGGDGAVHAAFRLSREMSESFPGISLVPYSSDPRAIDLYAEMARDFLGVAAESLEGEGAPADEILGSLSAAPEEGFLAALLAVALPIDGRSRLLEIGTLEV
jgi:hypothetical protein